MKKLLFALLCTGLILAGIAAPASSEPRSVIDVGPAGEAVAGGYKSGDVVEVLDSTGVWETGVVMPYRPYDKGTTTWVNVYRPSLPNMVAGTFFTLDKVRRGSLTNLKPPADWSTASISTIVDALMRQQGAAGPQNPPPANPPVANPPVANPGASIRPVGPRPNTGGLPSNPGNKPYVLPGKISEGVGSETPPPPALNGALPVLTGTSWKELFDHAAPVSPNWLFCTNGHWEIVRYAGAVGGMGSWRLGGNTLTLTDGTSGKSDNYSLTYIAEDRVLAVKGAGHTFYLLYNGQSQCK